ncbi:hypothetical protein GIB67_032254 [Kingdonia uniflora]|uniref:Pentatricopeptide repeat-containing protein n=1 Tax=Kingdonia uniflora TaxID=39325 RepID=A0A7J7MX80_9MAGN|nr:hypothetical protein GIB67_032254 [Kingdonia uniflora]
MLGNVGKTVEAEAVFEEMKEGGLKPRTRAYNALLKGYMDWQGQKLSADANHAGGLHCCIIHRWDNPLRTGYNFVEDETALVKTDDEATLDEGFVTPECDWCSSYRPWPYCCHIGSAITPFIYVACPNMMEFFDSLGVETEITDMPVAVSLYEGRSCEWGTRNGLSSLLKKNLLNPYFYQMIQEILKFKEEVIKFVEDLENNHDHIHSNETLEHFVKSHGYSELFQKAYLLPLCALIWSCPQEDVLSFSAFQLFLYFRFSKTISYCRIGSRVFQTLQSNCGVSILDFIPRVVEGTPHICLNHLNQTPSSPIALLNSESRKSYKRIILVCDVSTENNIKARILSYKSSSSAAAAGATKASEAADPAPASANRNSLPNPLDYCNVCANAWYLWMSASLTLLRANFIDSFITTDGVME